MRIGGFNKLTTQDYPEHLACIIFTQGCNFDCPYCQNRELIQSLTPEIDKNEIFSFLDQRSKMLDGIVISGGEPTIWNDLADFIKELKKYNLDIKLDTNGYRPKIVKQLIDEGLVDYIAMDIKAVPNKYSKIINKNIDFDKLKDTIDIIRKSNIKHEFRTTLIKGMHSIEDIEGISKLAGDDPYYLQNFQDSEYVIDKTLEGFSDDELKEIKKHFENKPNIKVRYI